MSYSKRDEDSGEIGLFYHLDKTAVLQEARVFNNSPINARKCRILLTKIIYLLSLGEPFASKEATDLFFNVIKLFQSKDTSLRQMMYLVIKELSGIAEDVIMVTQSLIKDIQSKQETIYRANAIRALCLITDPAMIQGIERILKASIVDKNPSVSSAALVSSYHLFDVAKDIVRRWSNEVQEAVHAKSAGSGLSSAASYMSSFGAQPNNAPVVISNSNITQYHALGLLYVIRQHDRMAVTKLVQTFSGSRSSGFLGGGGGSALKNPAAVCLLIRYACKVMEEDPGASARIYELLEGYLRHKSDMVNLEAARAICDIPDASMKELHPAIAVLQLFLSSPKPTLRFAAIRILNKLSLTNPAAVSPCNLDMENLITDQNRSVATFAITTLLKTGNEASVDRLMKQISGFMSEISDEFKVIVVEAIRSLCLKFPAKQVVMLNFLSGVLRDEGGYEFKKAVVEAIFDMVKFITDSKDAALSHLCEFIEDCEFTKLSVRILHVLGVEGPKAATPTKYIRYIYNRVILENSIIRAAAVSALAKFGVNVPDPLVKKSVKVLLTRCLDDVDDEVRDRATLYLAFMENEDIGKQYVQDDATFALPTLERQLVEYVNSPLANDKEFDLAVIPMISKAQEEDERRRLRTQDIISPSTPSVSAGATLGANGTSGSPSLASIGSTSTPHHHFAGSLDQQAVYAEQLAQIPAFQAFGTLFKSSSKPVPLTESETEYVVHCVKHTFARHVIFQFNCTNTLNDQLLENVHMVMQLMDDAPLVQVVEVPAPKLEYNVPGYIYVAFEQEDPEDLAVGSFSNTLKFDVKDCDPTTGEPDPEGYDDEYQVEDIELLVSDYTRPNYVSQFTQEWETLENELVETFALDKEKAPSLKVACGSILDLLGMQALEDSALPKSASVHTLLLAGTFLGGIKVLARCRMTFSNASGVAFELANHSVNPFMDLQKFQACRYHVDPEPVLAYAPSLPSSSIDTMLVIGEASHYHFYQSLNHQVSQHHLQRSSKYRSTTKKIIPSVPRQHIKAPVNSPLSFIRQQKLPQHITMIPIPAQPSSTNLLPTIAASKELPSKQRLTPCTDPRDDPTCLPDGPRGFGRQRRPRKVSFDEKVMVICTRFDDDRSKDDEGDEATPSTETPVSTHSYPSRRHSTGDHINTSDRGLQQRWLTFVTTLKHWKPTMHSHPSLV